MTPEKYVQNKIISFLKSIPHLKYERRQAGGFNYKKGAPDLWFVYHGVHCEVEVKAPGGYPSSLQLKEEDFWHDAGAYYWRGDNISDFIEFFNQTFCSK